MVFVSIGISIPVPAPCNMRNASNAGKDCERPQHAVPTVNRSIAEKKSALVENVLRRKATTGTIMAITIM